MKTPRNPDSVHQPVAGYAHQIEISGSQRWLVLSGQVGIDTQGSLPTDPIEQFGEALLNIKRNLSAANMEIHDIVKLTIYLVGEIESQRRRQVLASWLGGHTPAMTLVFVAALATPEIKVEIEALACKDYE
jgi:enamine deaminase RidA (YjgF/YER057c/UK114 family)